jgi:spore germination protein
VTEIQFKFIVSTYALAVSFMLLNFIAAATPQIAKTRSPVNTGFSVLAAQHKKADSDYVIYGFLPYWMLNKTEYIQLDKLTDIAYFGFNIQRNGKINRLDRDGNIDPGYNQWKNNKQLAEILYKAQMNGVRTAVTVISHNDDVSDAFLFCESCWSTLADELIFEMRSKSITDVNFDFEYEGYVENKTAKQYTRFIDYMNKRLDDEFENSFVVVSAYADSADRPRLTLIDELAEVADAIFIMAYDFHVRGSANAGPVAPIEGAGVFSRYDLSHMLTDYLKKSPPNKLIFGVPYYGYNWVVADTRPYAKRIDGDEITGYSVSNTYEKVVDTILQVRPTVKWDDTAKSPFLYYVSPNTNTYRMVYYDDVQSLKIKYDMIKSESLLGVGIWALGYDGGYQELWNLLDSEFLR